MRFLGRLCLLYVCMYYSVRRSSEDDAASCEAIDIPLGSELGAEDINDMSY